MIADPPYRARQVDTTYSSVGLERSFQLEREFSWVRPDLLFDRDAS